MPRYLVIVRADAAPFPAAQLQAIPRALARFAADGVALAFSDQSGGLAGLTIKSTASAAQLRAAVEQATAITGRGFILALALAEDFSAVVNSAGWRHLQH